MGIPCRICRASLLHHRLLPPHRPHRVDRRLRLHHLHGARRRLPQGLRLVPSCLSLALAATPSLALTASPTASSASSTFHKSPPASSRSRPLPSKAPGSLALATPSLSSTRLPRCLSLPAT